MNNKIEKTCIDCGKISFISKYNNNSPFCRSCGLKKENKVYRWDKVEKFIEKAYKRGCIDTRKEFRIFFLNILMSKFPQYRFLMSTKDENRKSL